MGTVLIIAAHPDDEVVGLGGQLPALQQVRIAHVTDGAPANMLDAAAYGFATREEYAAARRAELSAALELAGVDAAVCCTVGIADQAVSFSMAEAARRLRDILNELGPAVIYTHPYEGGHPDHDATAFAVRCACRLIGDRAPALREFTSYHARSGGMAAYEFLPYPDSPVTEVSLSPEALARKRDMLDAFTTQRNTLRPFYNCCAERWRPAPRYDFGAPPHAGTVYYDNFPWGIRSPEWRARAAEAAVELGLA